MDRKILEKALEIQEKEYAVNVIKNKLKRDKESEDDYCITRGPIVVHLETLKKALPNLDKLLDDRLNELSLELEGL